VTDEQKHRLLARSRQADLYREGIGAPLSRCREFCCNAVAGLFAQQADQLLSLQALRRCPEQPTDGTVRLLETPEAVEQRDTDGRAGEATPKPFGWSQCGLPQTLRRQVADDRACMQLSTRSTDILCDPGRHGPAGKSFEHDFSALFWGAPLFRKRAKRR
jgi:hypothetical protein